MMKSNISHDSYGYGLPAEQLEKALRLLRRLEFGKLNRDFVITVAQVSGGETLAVFLARLFDYPLVNGTDRRLRVLLDEADLNGDFIQQLLFRVHRLWQPEGDERNWPVRDHLDSEDWLKLLSEHCKREHQLEIFLHLAFYESQVRLRQLQVVRPLLVYRALDLVQSYARNWKQVIPELDLMFGRLEFTLAEIEPELGRGLRHDYAPFRWVEKLRWLKNSQLVEKHLALHTEHPEGLHEGMEWARNESIEGLVFKYVPRESLF